MQRMLELLHGIFYLATTEGDQPRVRPFDSAVEYAGRIYLGTANNKKVYAQMIANPKVEIFAMGEAGTLRLSGEVALEEDPERAKAAFQAMGKYGDGPTLAAFYITKGTAAVTEPDGSSETVAIGA